MLSQLCNALATAQFSLRKKNYLLEIPILLWLHLLPHQLWLCQGIVMLWKVVPYASTVMHCSSNNHIGSCPSFSVLVFIYNTLKVVPYAFTVVHCSCNSYICSDNRANPFNVPLFLFSYISANLQPGVAGSMVGVRLGLSEHIKESNAVFSLVLDDEDVSSIREVTMKGKDLMRVIGDCGDEYRRA